MAHLLELTQENMALQEIIEENGGEITEDIEQAFFENEAALATKVDGYYSIITYNENRAEICDKEIKKLTELKKQYTNASKKLKDLMKFAMTQRMDRTGEKTLQGDLHRFSLAATAPSLEVDDVEFAKPHYDEIQDIMERLTNWGFSVKIEPSKTLLKEMYPKGSEITPAGVKWSEPGVSLRIK